MSFFFEKETGYYSCKYCGNQIEHGPYKDVCSDCFKEAIEGVLELKRSVGDLSVVHEIMITLNLLKQELGVNDFREIFKLLGTIKKGDNLELLKELMKKS